MIKISAETGCWKGKHIKLCLGQLSEMLANSFFPSGAGVIALYQQLPVLVVGEEDCVWGT